jgi:hypothetical protein
MKATIVVEHPMFLSFTMFEIKLWAIKRKKDFGSC